MLNKKKNSKKTFIEMIGTLSSISYVPIIVISITALSFGFWGNILSVFDTLYVSNSEFQIQLKVIPVLENGTKGGKVKFLSNRGIVKVDFGNQRRVGQINKNGEVIFTDIPKEFIDGKFQFEFVDPEGEAYQVVNPDSVFQITNNRHQIILPIRRKLNNTISGFVYGRNESTPIPNVSIQLDSTISGFTNENGFFKIYIPDNKLKRSYELLLEKDGYEEVMLNLPNTSDKLRIEMDI